MNKQRVKKVFLLILALFCVNAQGIGPNNDTFIDEVNPDTINGARNYLIVRCMNLNPGELDSLLKFDLSWVPPEAQVKSAELSLYYYYYNDCNPVGRRLDAFRITGNWDEETTTWNNRPSLYLTPVATAYMPGAYGRVYWDVTNSVRGFHNGTYTNYGWQIMDVEENGNCMIYFRSNEYMMGIGMNPLLDIELNIIFVDKDAVYGANDGSRWASAYLNLQDALNAAVAGDQIWVAEGIYKPDEGLVQTPGDRTESFCLINDVAIYGGFAGVETSREQRDWENNVTILSGNIGNTGVPTDNSYHVVSSDSTAGPSAILDGFTIKRGYADGSSFRQDHGAGMLNIDSDPTIANCKFRYNTAESDGGGMYNYICDLTISNCLFSNNSAEEGGGMYNGGHSPKLSDCIFTENTAVDGGGMYNSQNSPVVSNCSFTSNPADKGGGMYNRQGEPRVINCRFMNNPAGNGGGVYNEYSYEPTFVNCEFINNTASENGGGMVNENLCSTAVINCSFSENSAVLSGGGIYNDIVSEPSFPDITNCILWGNSDSGGSDESAQIHGDSPTVTYSCIQDDDPNDGSIPFGGAANHNIDDDPLFVNAAAGDLKLLGYSPCFEVGNNAAVPADVADLDGDGDTGEQTPLDLDNDLRFRDGDCDGSATIDMGAYEFVWVLAGDLDGDCDVDFADFAILSRNWLAGT